MKTYQRDADALCDVYFDITGRDGIKNYLHCVRAGHFAQFLIKYKNIYCYSQQGWENINSVTKISYHHNTQKGGGIGGSSKLLPTRYPLARATLWRLSYLDGLFEHLGYSGKLDIDYGKIKRVPRRKDVDLKDVEIYANILIQLSDNVEMSAETDTELTAIPEGLSANVDE